MAAEQITLGAPPAEPGLLHQGIDFDDYRRAVGINASGLKVVLQSPKHFKAMVDGPSKPTTEAQRLGQLVHMCVLEPERFNFCRAVMPEFDRRTTKGKEGYAAWMADLPAHAIVLQPSDVARLDGIMASVAAHPRLKKMLAGGKSEASIWWQDPYHDVLCKARLDFVTAGGVCLDLKTTKDARPDPFARDAVGYHYHLQAVHYLAAATATKAFDDRHYLWVALEREPPYAVALYAASDSMLGIGEQWREDAMRRYAQAHKTGVWPSYDTKVRTLEAPAWAAVPSIDGDA